jgi:tRNA threonylcarbamoyladenosine biosynthesis protein TsaB
MLLLGLETATPQAGVALGGPDGVRASVHLVNNGRHAESLTPAIEFVCRLSGTELKSLTAVAVDIGPGLFTGLRVGLATAKAIAFAHGIPTIPVSSLEILAYAARLTERTIIAVIDALSDEVYSAPFAAEPGAGVRPLGVATLVSPGALADEVRRMSEKVLLVGDGATRYANLFDGMDHVAIGDGGMKFPTAVSLIEIAAGKALRQEFASAAEVEIQYLRRPYVHSKT